MTRADGFVWMKDSPKVQHFNRLAAKYAKLGRKHVARKYRRKAEAQMQIDLQRSRRRYASLVDRALARIEARVQRLAPIAGGVVRAFGSFAEAVLFANSKFLSGDFDVVYKAKPAVIEGIDEGDVQACGGDCELTEEEQQATAEVCAGAARGRCKNDSDGDGDCHLCARKPGGCPFKCEEDQSVETT